MIILGLRLKIQIKFYWNPSNGFREEVIKSLRVHGDHFWRIDLKKTLSVAEDVGILFPVTFRRFPFRGCIGEVEKWVSQSEARAAIFVDGSAKKAQAWLRMLRSCVQSSFLNIHSEAAEKESFCFACWSTDTYGRFDIWLADTLLYSPLQYCCMDSRRFIWIFGFIPAQNVQVSAILPNKNTDCIMWFMPTWASCLVKFHTENAGEGLIYI